MSFSFLEVAVVIQHGSGDQKHVDLVFAVPGLKASLGSRTESSSEESSGSISDK